jgi:DNA-binding response OmpR family regulator
MVDRILIVDDEPMLRQLSGRALREAGYEVEEAEDGLAGWEAARRAPRPFSLVVTDSKMPRMNGAELVRHLRELDPKLPIISLSGSYGQAEAGSPHLSSGILVLSKPFQLEQLVTLVGEMLHRRSRS